MVVVIDCFEGCIDSWLVGWLDGKALDCVEGTPSAVMWVEMPVLHGTV